MPIVVLHVVHDPESEPGFYSRPKRAGSLTRMEDAAKEIMSSFMAKMRKKHSSLRTLKGVHEYIVIGLPSNRILEVAESIDARHIVLGSQGRTGLSRVLLGSKAERIVQLAPVPVTIVKDLPRRGRR